MEDLQLGSQNPSIQRQKEADSWQQYEDLGSALISSDWMECDYFIPYHFRAASTEAQVQNANLVGLLDFDPSTFYN